MNSLISRLNPNYHQLTHGRLAHLDSLWTVDPLLGGTHETVRDSPCRGCDCDGGIHAACVTIAGKPATMQSKRVYSSSDGKNDRCTSTYTEKTSIGSLCQVDNEAPPGLTPGSGAYDTQATCKIDLADFGAASAAAMINTCSYPSREPTSAPSDCVLIPGVRETGAIEITKTDASANCTAASTTWQGAGVALLNGAEFSITGTGAPSGAAGP